MAFPHIGGPELIIILVVVIIIFGVGKLPQVGGAIGKGLREFRKARTEEDEEAEEQQPKKSTKKAKS